MGAAVLAAAALWAAAPATADALPRVVLCDDFASVDAAQVSFCIEDAQGAVLGGGVSPTADVLPTVVADPAVPGGWGLTFPEGWAGTAVMGSPPIVATPPPAATPSPPPSPAKAAPATTARAASAPATAPAPASEPAPAESPAPAAAAPSVESVESPTAAPADAAGDAKPASEDTASQGSGATWWLGAALLAIAAAAALRLRRHRAYARA